jgi:hypothetical protein
MMNLNNKNFSQINLLFVEFYQIKDRYKSIISKAKINKLFSKYEFVIFSFLSLSFISNPFPGIS